MNEAEHPLDRQIRHGILPPVFIPSSVLVILLVAMVLIFPDWSDHFFSQLNNWVTSQFGWFYSLSLTCFLILAIAVALSRFGETRLGGDHERPRYSFISWVAMLFSAGMGIGLLFFGVGEPIMHYSTPPEVLSSHPDLARQAMELTFLHWGLHGWAVYAMIGLCLAYFSFRHNLPLTIRSALYPLIGDRIYGPIGHAVDVFAVLGTLFGVATSLGYGASQVNAGLNYLFDVPDIGWVKMVLIAGITAMATVSVAVGLDKGIKRLSEANMLLALVLLIFVLVFGPTLTIFASFTENLGNYAGAILERGLKVGVYSGDTDWINSWTIFYWGWWISWSPFVGMFIARVSRGRTIREFILGVLIVPTLLVFIWMTVFGNTALDMVAGGHSELVTLVKDNLPVALFAFLDQLPFSFGISVLAIVLIVTFFVTSADSGALVIDIISAGGRIHSPVWQRVFWAVAIGLVAAVLLVNGGLHALQAATVASALPFTVVIIFACAGLLRALSMESRIARGADVAPDIAGGGVNMPWRLRLGAILAHPTREMVEAFVQDIVRPALKDVMEEIRDHDSAASAFLEADAGELIITHEGEPSFHFSVKPVAHAAPVFAIATATNEDDDGDDSYFRAEVFLAAGGKDYDIYGFSKDQVIHEVLNHYNHHMHYLDLTRGHEIPLEQK